MSGSIRTPLASESRPLTSRKNCGIANVSPNSANEVIVDSVVPQVKPAEREQAEVDERLPARPPADQALPAHEQRQQHDTGHHCRDRGRVRPAILAGLMTP